MESWLQTCRRSPAECAQDLARTGTLRLSFGDLTPRVGPDHLFTVSATLVDTAIDHDEMVDTLRSHGLRSVMDCGADGFRGVASTRPGAAAVTKTSHADP